MRSHCLLVIVLVAACGDDNSTKGSADARQADGSTTPTPDAAPCAAGDITVSSQVVALDSTTVYPGPIVGATIAMVDEPGRTAMTGTDGWFSLCAPDTAPYELTLDAPGDYFDLALSLESAFTNETQLEGRQIRTLTPTHAATMYDDLGLTFEATKAHLFVLMPLDSGNVTIDATHDQAHAALDPDSGITWDVGTEGRIVLFPNIDVTGSSVELTKAASIASGPLMRPVPVAAGKVTFATANIVYGP